MRLLLATDGSENSEEAARFITRLPLSPSDEILVLHVVSAIPYEDDYHAQVKQAIRRVAPKILRASADILKPAKAIIRTDEAEGYPDFTIIEKAVNTDADLIVMGARGVKGVKLLFLGSSTRSVALNSPKPLLVVKKSPWSHTPFRVLFATDGSETADEAGRFLAAMPLGRDAELTVMHVTWSAASEIPEKFIAEIGDQIEGQESWFRTVGYGRAEEVLGRARSYLGERFPRMNFLTQAGDPSGQILEAEKSIETDLIVVGCRGVRGLRGMMGSVSRRILSHSRSSILIGRPCAPAD